jgi:hypothetical protein
MGCKTGLISVPISLALYFSLRGKAQAWPWLGVAGNRVVAPSIRFMNTNKTLMQEPYNVVMVPWTKFPWPLYIIPLDAVTIETLGQSTYISCYKTCDILFSSSRFFRIQLGIRPQAKIYLP